MKGSQDHGIDTLQIERSLGFWWPRGISRQKGRCEVPVVKALLDTIAPVIRQYSTTLPSEIRASHDLETQANKIFDVIGPTIWPDPSVDRSRWLATNADSETLEGSYPRDLYFSSLADQAKLRKLFHGLLVRKCITRYSNQLSALSRCRQIAQDSHGRLGESIADNATLSDGDEEWEPEDEIAVSRPRSKASCMDPARPSPNSLAGSDAQTNYYLQDCCVSTNDNGKRVWPTESREGIKKLRVASLMVIVRLAPEKLAGLQARELAPRGAVSSGVSAQYGRRQAVGEPELRQAISNCDAISSHVVEAKRKSPVPFARDAGTVEGTLKSTPLVHRGSYAYPTTERLGDHMSGGDAGWFNTSSSQAVDAGIEQGPAQIQSQTVTPQSKCQSRPQPALVVPVPGINMGPQAERSKRQMDDVLIESEHLSRPSIAPDNIFEDIQVEIDWNRGIHVPDYMILEDCETVSEFFKLIEDQLPSGLERFRENIKQVKVQAINQTTGPKFDCRIQRNRLGRGALKQLLKKLRLPRMGDPLELKIQVEWRE